MFSDLNLNTERGGGNSVQFKIREQGKGLQVYMIAIHIHSLIIKKKSIKKNLTVRVLER